MNSGEPKILPLSRKGSSSKSPGTPPLREGFHLGPENRAIEIAMKWILEGAPVREGPRWNPITFYGPSGCGKSHLVFGIYQKWKEQHRRSKAVFQNGSDFLRQFRSAVETRTSDDFRLRVRSAPLWVLDHFEEIKNSKDCCEEFLHALDESLLAGNTVILTMRRFPGEQSGISPKITDRLIAGLSLAISNPGLKTRGEMIREIAAHFKIPISRSMVLHAAKSLDLNYPGLQGVFSQLVLQSRDKAPDTREIRHFLKTYHEDKQPPLELILRETAKHFALKQSEIRGKSRRSPVARARAVGIYLSRQLTGHSLKTIGTFYGGRDHKTVAHHCEETEIRMSEDMLLRNSVIHIRESIAQVPTK